jgi:hypothetical protein
MIERKVKMDRFLVFMDVHLDKTARSNTITLLQDMEGNI